MITLTKKIEDWLMREHKTLAVHLEANHVILVGHLTSPFMGLFANWLPLDTCLRVLDRFLLFGEKGILDIVKTSIEGKKSTIL